MINGFNETGNSAKSKKNILNELNEQPDTWYCPECGNTLVKTDNSNCPYYCSNCKKIFSKDLSKYEYVGISLKK